MALRTLLVDDDADLLAMMQESLMDLGVAVESRRTVEDALVLLQTERFDIVVTDLGLEHTGGLAFCRDLGAQFPSLPIVVLTGYDDAQAAALRLGVKKVLIKPVSMEDLYGVLVAAVAGKPS